MINLRHTHNSDAFYNMLTIIFLLFIFMVLIIALCVLVWKYIELYKALENLNYANPILAFIPFANYYALASLCDEADGKVNVIGIDIDMQLFKLWWLVNIGITFIPFIGEFISPLITIICLGKCYTNLYEKLENRKDTSLEIRGYFSFITIVAAISLFISNRRYNSRINNNINLSKY